MFPSMCFLPTDNYANIISDDIHDTLNTLEAFISSLNVDCIIIGGDYNVDFHVFNAHKVELVSFLENTNVIPCTNSLTIQFL